MRSTKGLTFEYTGFHNPMKAFRICRVLTAFHLVLSWANVCAEEGTHSRKQIENDLVLQATLKTPKTIQVGEQVSVDMLLRNRSKSESYPVVQVGDGSEVGWREPYIFFTATLETPDGVTKQVPRASYVRCGNFDYDWLKDAIALKPSGDLRLHSYNQPSVMLEFQEQGHIRLTAHYSYRVGPTPSNANQEIIKTGLMAGVPAFDLISTPIEFDVERPLDLVLKAKPLVGDETAARISDFFDIRLTNRSKKAIEVTSPTLHGDPRIFLEIEGQGMLVELTKQKSQHGEKFILKPAQEVAVIGDGLFANGMDGTWEKPVSKTLRVRAGYLSLSVIYSNWVEIKTVLAKQNEN